MVPFFSHVRRLSRGLRVINGAITGLNPKHVDEVGLCAMVANNTVPPLFVKAEIIKVESYKVMQIHIPKSKSIIATSSGKILRRRLKSNGEPENIPMYPYEITTRLSDLSLLDFSFQIIENASFNDFDLNELSRLKNLIKKSHGDEYLLDLDDEELGKALQLVREERGTLYPTITGLLLIGKKEKIEEFIPTARATFQVLEGTNIRKNESYCLPLLELLETLETNFDAWNVETEVEEGFIRTSVPEFSKRAFREALVNAFSHRDYTMMGEVRVAIDNEGLTISNPGGFIEGVTLENLLSVEPHRRNQALANTLKRIGLAEKTGRGIDRIFEASISVGRPWPDYSESTSTKVKVFIQKSKPDIALMSMIRKEEARTGKELAINSLLILSCAKIEGRITNKKIRELTHISENRIHMNVEILMKAGLLEANGQGEKKELFLSPKHYESSTYLEKNKMKSNNKEVDFERKVLQTAGIMEDGITRKDVMLQLSITKDQAYRLLQKLVEENKLQMVGSGRGTRYKI